MKKQTEKLFVALIALTLCCSIYGQEKTTQAYWVHEDVVKPSMVGEYETICKELTENLKKHNIQEVSTIVTSTADSRYLWVSSIENMADIDRPIFATLAEKMGEAAMTALFDRMDKCYNIEQNYVIHLDKELSYMPGGITQTPEGQNYRKFHYLHYAPENRAMIKEKMKSIREMFEQKGSKVDYRVYRSGFGTRGEFYMVAVAAKDAVSYASNAMTNDALLGEDGNKMMGELFSSLLKYEEFIGRMRPDMAYSPAN